MTETKPEPTIGGRTRAETFKRFVLLFTMRDMDELVIPLLDAAFECAEAKRLLAIARADLEVAESRKSEAFHGLRDRAEKAEAQLEERSCHEGEHADCGTGKGSWCCPDCLYVLRAQLEEAKRERDEWKEMEIERTKELQTAVADLLDADHEWAQWREKWTAALDLMANQSHRAHVAEAALAEDYKDGYLRLEELFAEAKRDLAQFQTGVHADADSCPLWFDGCLCCTSCEKAQAELAEAKRKAAEIVERLRARWPHIEVPMQSRITTATATNVLIPGDPGPPTCLRCALEEVIGEGR